MKYLVDKTDFRENIKIELLNVSKENLLEDFEDSPRS
jgi:type VI secretion system protein ImpC